MTTLSEQLSSLFIKSPVEKQVPKIKDEVKLWDYQEETINWMNQQEHNDVFNGVCGGIVALMMGLGKTLIALNHIVNSRVKYKEEFPTLVVLSKTLLYEWKRQGVEKFFENSLKPLYFHKDLLGPMAVKKMSCKKMKTYDIVFTTYDTLMTAYKIGEYKDFICEVGESGIHKDKVVAIHHRDRPEFNPKHFGVTCLYEMPWERIICDESQRFANPKTITFKTLMAVYAKYRWCLTGTPIRNKGIDIWAQLRFCGFSKVYHSRLWKRTDFDIYNCKNNMKILSYDEAKVEMPEKIDEVTLITMSSNQKKLYETMLEALQNMFAEFCKSKSISYIYILALFTRLRQIVIAPYLISAKGEDKNKIANTISNDVISENKCEKWISNFDGSSGINSPKIKKIVEIIKDVISKNQKVIVFSMFTSALAIVEKALTKENIISATMIGSTKVDERLSIMTGFKETSEINVLLTHYKVGGEGINLTEATHVIPIEPWWNHAVHNQGIFRAWRRGQKFPVTVHWVISQNTIEPLLLRMCENKQEISNSYLYGDAMPFNNVGITKEELRSLISTYEECQIEEI